MASTRSPERRLPSVPATRSDLTTYLESTNPEKASVLGRLLKFDQLCTYAPHFNMCIYGMVALNLIGIQYGTITVHCGLGSSVCRRRSNKGLNATRLSGDWAHNFHRMSDKDCQESLNKCV